jgi:hypothetical protein
MRIRVGLAFGVLSIYAAGQILTPGAADGSAVILLNEPFSADAVTTTSRTLPDGTHITRQTTVKMYRDSAGRTRTDRNPGQLMAGQAAPPAVIVINDPVSGYNYILETANKIVRRSPIKSSRPPMRPNPSATVATPPPAVANNLKPRFKTEDLGTQTMEGLIVQGRRSSFTFPVGSVGNDREITNVSEVWTNNELRLMLLQTHSDPRNGEVTTKIENLSRTQPDANLFEPPADYAIVDSATNQ